ncbi:MAG: LURP-one-related family protein [Clostridia bacterium]|nr:LURP-one-related family protein [Clostridia bacterium]
MKLLFKQRMFSWFCSYDIFDPNGNTVFTVEGQLSWGHKLHIHDAAGNHIGTVKQVVLSFLPAFEIYIGDTYMGRIRKEFTFFKPQFSIEFNGWQVQGDWFEWDYDILSARGERIATVSKQLFNWTDTYEIDVLRQEDSLAALMLVLAIDAEKCSRNG